MTTEILVIFIVLGAIIVFMARKSLLRNRRKIEELASPDVVKKDAGAIRSELEQAADEIIKRMDVRVDRLEFLIREADKRAGILQKRLEELERLEVTELQESTNLKSRDSKKTKINPNAEFARMLADSLQATKQRMEPSGEAESFDINPDEIEAYLKSRSVDEIPDTDIPSMVDNGQEYNKN